MPWFGELPYHPVDGELADAQLATSKRVGGAVSLELLVRLELRPELRHFQLPDRAVRLAAASTPAHLQLGRRAAARLLGTAIRS